ncbi:MAG: hypothetical protein K9I36_16465 [Bacteroidia bacterium]|nr:hypothetical protein [Bacteroidia bacterium]MCF8428332.1 hypothetical protein [Bacteroidia bacterium]
MKKLVLLGAFVALGYFSSTAQTVSAAPNPETVSAQTVSAEEPPAKPEKKAKKSKKGKKGCSDEKGKSCGSGEKKSCCSEKGHGQAAPAKKDDHK